jgi:hypothetical protein
MKEMNDKQFTLMKELSKEIKEVNNKFIPVYFFILLLFMVNAKPTLADFVALFNT